jgi:hypothetical protein
VRVFTILEMVVKLYYLGVLLQPREARAMVQAFDANDGGGIPEVESANITHQTLIGEVLDFVQEHKALSAIAGIGVTAGAIYLARAPIARCLGRLGGSIVAAEDAATVAGKLGKTPLGRELAVAGEDVVVASGAVDDVITGGVKAAEGASDGAKPLLGALDEAAKAGKLKTPEPWVYHPENRGLLKDLPKGGTGEIKSAEGGLDAATTAHSTHSPDAVDIANLGFPGLTKAPIIDVTKHRFLRGK